MSEKFTAAKNKGLEGVVACDSSVSAIVGDTLCYRGYTIEDLAKNASFEEVVFLLWHSKKPSSKELDDFKNDWLSSMQLSDSEIESLKFIIKNSKTGSHPMHYLRTAVSLLGCGDSQKNLQDPAVVSSQSMIISAKTSSIVACYTRLKNNLDIPKIDKEKSISWNFLNMLFGKEPTEEQENIFNTCLILHADHGLNCSTFSSRVVSSSLSDLYSAVVAAIGALKGPLHGGANEAVLLMLNEIGSIENVEDFIETSLKNKRKIMGIGHRVYKQGDPRAKILKSMSESQCKLSGNEKLFTMSNKIEKLLLDKKGLKPNVDFYSATLYYSMGIPVEIYTLIFASSRVVGWCSHVKEQWEANRIYRPLCDYTGETSLTW